MSDTTKLDLRQLLRGIETADALIEEGHYDKARTMLDACSRDILRVLSGPSTPKVDPAEVGRQVREMQEQMLGR